MKYEFEDIKFKQDKEEIYGVFLDIFKIPLDIEGDVKNGILYSDISERKFNNLLSKGFQNMTNICNNKKAVYVHKNSGIPLIGNVSFGIVDRNSTIIEIKPITSCNIDCIYCSVSEDKRPVDFVVEADYMVEELNKLIDFKEKDVEIHIGCQGEPLRYARLSYLVKEITKNKRVIAISMDTNGTLLTKKKIDELIESGFTRFNISLNAIDKELAGKIANHPYNHDHVIKMIKYVASKNVELVIAPVWIPNVNDEEIEKIVKFASELNKKQDTPIVGVQKYLRYRSGRLLKEKPWDDFYDKLKKLEKKHNLKLILSSEDFKVEKTKTLPKPFKKNEIIDAKVISPGRLRNEKICVAKRRTISVMNPSAKGKVKLKIKRTKHNIFTGELIN